MKKSTIAIIGGLVLVAIIAGIVLFTSSNSKPVDLLEANLTAKGDAPAAQSFANDFIRQLEEVSRGKVSYQTIKETSKTVVLQNIQVVLQEPTNNPTTLNIAKASFQEDGTATLEQMVLVSEVDNKGKLGLGVKQATIQDYQKANGVVTSITQEFKGGIATGPAFEKIKTQYNAAQKMLQNKPAAVRDIPAQITDGLADLNGAAEYTYDQRKKALVTGLRLSMPNLVSARLSFAFDEVSEESAKQMQNHVIFGSSIQSILTQVKNGKFNGVMTKARLKLVDLGVINKAIAVLASLQKKSEPVLREELKTILKAYQAPANTPLAVQQTITDVRNTLSGVVDGKYSTIVINLVPKENAPKVTLAQAVNAKLATYDILVAGE